MVQIYKNQYKSQLFVIVMHVKHNIPKSHESVWHLTVWSFCNIAILNFTHFSLFILFTFHKPWIKHTGIPITANSGYNCASCIFQFIRIFKFHPFNCDLIRENMARSIEARSGLCSRWSRTSSPRRSISRWVELPCVQGHCP